MVEKATITNTVTGERIPVYLNPEEYTLAKTMNYAQVTVPGLSSPILQFVNGNLQTLNMELLVDTYEDDRDVRELTDRIFNLMSIDPGTHAPPVLLFAWSSLTFLCVLASVNQRFILFRQDGTPVRARLQVAFNEYRNAELEAKEVKRETSDYSKLHTVMQRETLSLIAEEVYGDPHLWRPIALFNGINTPRTLVTGSQLMIPRLPYRDPESGEVYD